MSMGKIQSHRGMERYVLKYVPGGVGRIVQGICTERYARNKI